MTNLKAIPNVRRIGSEPFHIDGTDLPNTLLNFWQWSSSEVVGNALRGMLAEYIVAKLLDADLIPFVRYEEYDTQYTVPTGVVKDGANDRTDITVGINFPLTQQFVLKADYQFKYSEAASDPNNVFNLGMGWVFQ